MIRGRIESLKFQIKSFKLDIQNKKERLSQLEKNLKRDKERLHNLNLLKYQETDN